MGRVLLALVSTLFLVTQVMAGTWTSNNFLYKPALGARGDDEKAKFDSGLNRVDSRLANEKWLNDLPYGGDLGTAITAIGSAKTVLSIPAGNWPVAANLTVPANLTLNFAHGAVLAIATGKTLTINSPLEAGRYQIFSCSGTGKVVLGSSVPRAYVQWWGGSSTINSTAAVNAALASLSNGIVDLGSDTIKIDGQVNWDISKCDLLGNGAKFDATGNSGVAIQASNGSALGNVFYPWSKRRSGGFELVGDKVTHPSCVGLEISGSYEISGFRLYNVVAHGFNIAFNLDLPAYIYGSSFNECAFYDSIYAVKVTHGGETITFNNSLMFNSTYGFYVGDGGKFRLINCHINYNNQAVYAANSAHVVLTNPFIESNADTNYWITCSGGSTAVILKGGIITNACLTPKTYNVGLADQCGSQGIVLDGTLLSAFSAANYGVNDIIKVTDYTGAVQFRGVRPFIASNGLPTVPTSRLMLSSHVNYLRNGGFETDYAVDWTTTAGTSYNPPVLDAVEHHAGAQSLKFAPAAGKQTEIIRSIPCRVGEWARMTFWVKNNLAASTDTFRIEAGYLAADGSAITPFSLPVDLSQAGNHYNTWTQLWITPYYPAPAGAVSAYFKFKVGTGVSDGNGQTWIDDVQINMWIQ